MLSLAFCSSAWRPVPPTVHPTRQNLCTRRRPYTRACAGSPGNPDVEPAPDSVPPPPASYASSIPPLPVEAETLTGGASTSDVVSATADAATSTAQALLDDVGANPQYYLNVSGVLVGISLSVVVLSATVMALDTIPVVPDVLRIIGLGYLFWFLAKFLFNSSERARLAVDVDEFVAGVRGGEFRVVQDTHTEAE